MCFWNEGCILVMGVQRFSVSRRDVGLLLPVSLLGVAPALAGFIPLRWCTDGAEG